MKSGCHRAAWGTLLAGIISGPISLAVFQHFYEIKWKNKNKLLIQKKESN